MLLHSKMQTLVFPGFIVADNLQVYSFNGFYYLLINPKEAYLKPVSLKTLWMEQFRRLSALGPQAEVIVHSIKTKSQFLLLSNLFFTCVLSAHISHDCFISQGISLPHHPLITFPSIVPSYSAQSKFREWNSHCQNF